MSDIDFEELDKAVNNLMGNVKPEKTTGDEVPRAKTLEVKDTLEPGQEPEYQKLGEAAQKIGNEALVTEREQTLVEDFDPSELTTKPEFNTVMQKAGDETKDESAKPPETQPDGSAEKPTEEKKPEETAPTPVAAPAVKPPTSGRFMDVVHPSSDMRSDASSNLSVPPRTFTPPPVNSAPTAVPTPPTEDPASQTPFLPDANEKVEKRPLGAVPTPFGGEKTEESQPKVEEPTKVETTDEQEPPVETTPINNEDRKATSDVNDEQHPIDATNTGQFSEEEKQLQSVESVASTEESVDAFGTSIAMVESGDTESLRNKPADQGKGKKSEESGAILGTEDHHQPLAHPQKQKSGWGKVLIIILIIIIFAAAGGAAYFLLG